MIYGLGEIIFDIILKDEKPAIAIAGGSALNTIISLAHSDKKTAMISIVGNDLVGKHIMDFIQNSGINNKYILRHSNYQTPIALAFLNNENDAQYQFYKEKLINPPLWKLPKINKNDILLISSSFCVSDIGLDLISQLTTQKPILFYDPNIRTIKGISKKEHAKRVSENIKKTDIIRASNEDMLKIYNISNSVDAWEKIRSYGNKQFIYSCGKQGVYFFNNKFQFHLSATPGITPISTVGAGDTLNAGIINGILNRNLDEINNEEWQVIIKQAINWAEIVCMKLENYI